MSCADPYDLTGLPPINQHKNFAGGSMDGVEDLTKKLEEEEAQALAKFKALDVDGSGKLERPEFETLLKELELGLDEENMKKYTDGMLKHYDNDEEGSEGHGTIEAAEFVKMFREIFMDKHKREEHKKKVRSKFMSPDDVKKAREAFFQYDKDSSGEIDVEELKTVLVDLGCLKNGDTAGWEGVLREVRVIATLHTVDAAQGAEGDHELCRQRQARQRGVHEGRF